MGSAPSAARALRVLLVANDGLGAGHITRQLAVARALGPCARERGVEVSSLLATTSEAHALIDASGATCLRLPSIGASRRAGLAPAEHRRLCEGVLGGAIDGFAPDVLVVDTFPSGPHGELASLLERVPRRALVRRTVRADRADEPEARAGLERYHTVIVPDDPVAQPLPPMRRPGGGELSVTRVAPITLFEAGDGLARGEARARLGLPAEGRLLLISAGGGGDAEARRACVRAALWVKALPSGNSSFTPVLALGPLGAEGAEEADGGSGGGGAGSGAGGAGGASDARRASAAGVVVLRAAPLQRHLAAFDAAIAPAGYNTAHELAKAGVPSALFARARPFDDQLERARRFATAGLAVVLSDLGDESLRWAMAWASSPNFPPGNTSPGGAAGGACTERGARPTVRAGGARAAAQAVLALVGVGA
jgi:UDP-N-acetylglucosamine--N-acetylmuramyl-(pentapeptide) pyrophosphoryl-undecaprenol N-acetylglucosamine transferase